MSKNQGVNIHIETPECDRMIAVQNESQIIGVFLEWLQEERNFVICSLNQKDDYYPVGIGTNNLLAQYFKIDLNKVERERAAILEGIRAARSAGKE